MDTVNLVSTRLLEGKMLHQMIPFASGMWLDIEVIQQVVIRVLGSSLNLGLLVGCYLDTGSANQNRAPAFS